MAVEEPEVFVNIEFGQNYAFACLAAITVDLGDAIEHQHIINRQFGVARSKEIAHTTGDKFVFGVGIFRGKYKFFSHLRRVPRWLLTCTRFHGAEWRMSQLLPNLKKVRETFRQRRTAAFIS